MSNLTINERIKDIAIPGQNENFYSNIKKFFGEIIKFEPKILNQLEIIKKGVFLEEENFDFIGNTEKKEDIKLDEKGYEETSADNFHLEPYNAANVTKVNEVKNHKLFNKTIKFLSNTKEELLIFEKQENNIFVFKNNKKNLFLEIKCINGKLIDFGFCNNNFLYILYEYENQLCLLKTHKTYSFFIEHDEEISTLDLLNCEYFFNIKNITYKEKVTDTTEEFIDIKNSKLFSDSKNNIFLLNRTNKYKVNPIKKYYCFKDGLYFYNKTKDVSGQFNGIKNFKQIEHLFLYELVKMFGLENFKTTNIRSYTNNLSNISSENNTEIKNLFKFKFDNTLNGLINFFNFSETKSNFYVNIDNGKIICKGNIYNETINKSQNKYDNNRDNKRGDYKITIKILEKVFGKEDIIKCIVRLHKKTNEGIYEIIDSKKLFSSKSFDELTRSLFYSNLEFYFYNFEYQKDEEFEILFKYNYDPEIKFIEAETFVENKIIPGIQDIKYKVHNPKGIVINNKQKHDNLDFKIEGNHLLFKNIELNNDKKLNSKLKKENFKIPLIINGKATNTFKTLNKSKNFYVEYEDLVEFNSTDIAKQIEDEKEIILILED